jgi:hypothetical protein
VKPMKNIPIYLTSALLFIYVFVRAYELSFTHDESLSYTILNGNEVFAATANNHILNTKLMALSRNLFGNSEIALRLPNVLAFLVYMLSSYLIIRRTKSTIVLFGWFCFLVINPFTIEFFSLARGYGISLSMVMLSLHFLLQIGNSSSLDKNNIIAVSGSLLFAILAVIANLSCINYLLSLQAILAFRFLLKGKWPSAKPYWIIIGLSTFPLIIVVRQLLDLQKANELYFGNNHFLEGLKSLILESTGSIFYSETLALIAQLIIFLAFVAGVSKIIYTRNLQSSFSLVVQVISLILLGLFVEHYLFGAKFPHERTAIYYIPILTVFLYLFFTEIKGSLTLFPARANSILSVIFICLVLVNFLIDANIRHTKTWRYDSHTKDVMKLVKEKNESADTVQTISNHWLFEPSINYYISTLKINMNTANRDGIHQSTDFIYRLEDKEELQNHTSIQYFEDTNSELLMRH